MANHLLPGLWRSKLAPLFTNILPRTLTPDSLQTRPYKKAYSRHAFAPTG